MRSEIHAAVPLWINTPLEPPLPSGSPVTERWRLVQKHLPPLAELLDVEIVIMNAEGYCVGGTGPYLRGVGFRMPADNALTYSLRSGQSSMVLTPGKEEVCRTCSGKGACADVANFTGPVVIENEIVAVVQIVAFTDNQRAELLMKSEKVVVVPLNLRIGDEVGKGVRAHQPDHRFRMGPRTRRGIAPRTTAR